MTIKDQIIALFENNKGVYLSGEDIADKLNVTRAAVWKAVKSLQDAGYQIDAVTNKGYCLSSDTDIISVSGIKKYLRQDTEDLVLEVYESVTSTNLVLREKANAGARQGTVVIAASQTGGRGRLGRSFYSPDDTGIYLSILLRPDQAAGDATLITTAAAVAVCEAIEKISDTVPQIKWVNDVFIDGKKVCGILTEASFGLENGKIEYAVLGIGINVYTPLAGFPDEIKNIVGSVLQKRQSDAKNRLAAEVLNNFFSLYQKIGNREFINEYKRRSFVIGKRITVLSGEKAIPATALDIDENCRLIVQYDDGSTAALYSGEISIKL